MSERARPKYTAGPPVRCPILLLVRSARRCCPTENNVEQYRNKSGRCPLMSVLAGWQSPCRPRLVAAASPRHPASQCGLCQLAPIVPQPSKNIIVHQAGIQHHTARAWFTRQAASQAPRDLLSSTYPADNAPITLVTRSHLTLARLPPRSSQRFILRSLQIPLTCAVSHTDLTLLRADTSRNFWTTPAT